MRQLISRGVQMLEVDICSAECVCWSSLLVLARIVVVVLTVTV